MKGPGEGSESGHGPLLVAALAERLGLAAVRPSGKTVWAGRPTMTGGVHLLVRMGYVNGVNGRSSLTDDWEVGSIMQQPQRAEILV